MLELTGRTAIVTGGATGIGAAAVAALRSRDIRVVSLDVASGGPAEIELHCDVGDPASIDVAFAEALVQLGTLDYAFCNAGIAGRGSVLGLSVEAWDHVLDVDLRGMFLTVQAAARAMKDNGGGAIVCTASTSGIVAPIGHPHYAVAKAGVQQLVRVAARELGPFGIRINAIAPGMTNTPLTRGAQKLPGYIERVIEGTPMRRVGEPDDVAEVVLGLFAMQWVTGQLLAADGGISLATGVDIPGWTPEVVATW